MRADPDARAMLFNSYEFIFAFLPLTLLAFHLAARGGHSGRAIGVLLAASLLFYGYWKPVYLGLIVLSIAVNYAIGRHLREGESHRKAWLVLGLILNLGALGYFKYANFFVETLDSLTGVSLQLAPIFLPLAISFFTFQQVAYLVDAYRCPEESEGRFWHYALFVSFFPQLIAGPIVHHRELMPQLADGSWLRLKAGNLSVGAAYFLAGLFKKAVIADACARFSDPVFRGVAAGGAAPDLVEAWVAMLGYTTQLYFDFSGYSDMAIGLGWMFGLRLPLNFDSPYKSASIIEFWRRWHITLSSFLRDYLYIPLGGSRHGKARRYVNLMITMLLGGLWHGAGWSFVLWGGMHGGALVLNHGIRSLGLAPEGPVGRRVYHVAGRIVTLAVVALAWIPFRAADFTVTRKVLRGVLGMEGARLPENYLAPASKLVPTVGEWFSAAQPQYLTQPLWHAAAIVGCALVIALFAPNTQEIFAAELPPTGTLAAPRRWYHFEHRPAWAVAVAVAATWGVATLSGNSEFLYFQF